jgi:sensor histidine kinase YesM
VKKLAAYRPFQHILFWGVAFYVLYRIFATPGELLRIDLWYTGIFIFTLLPGIYLNLLLLIPRLLSLRRYFLYLLILSLVMGATAGFNILMFSVLIDYLLPGYYFISYFDFFDLMKFVVAVTGITTLLKLSKGWFLLMDAKSRLAAVEKEHTESKLLALKSQLNPHFLFNSLAGIYSMVLKQSPETPTVVLRLSDFLRYILYESNTSTVSLSGELAAMRDYVELQKLRAGPAAEISFEVSGNPENHFIAPLLLLPLIENSFKHGIKGAIGPTFASFRFIIRDEVFSARVRNNKGLSDEPENSRFKGIGLQNLRQRLEMLYPGKYSFEVTDSESSFTVDMKVPIYGKA